MTMLDIIFVILLLAWIGGYSFHIVAGGLIHILLVAAIITLLVRIIRGGRV